jgi:hypothetical protein
MIEGSALVKAFFYLVIWALIFAVLYWVTGQMSLGPPWDKAIKVLLALGAALVLINLLLGLIGTPLIRWPGK